MKTWGDWFYYDESSPSCLKWKVDVGSGKGGIITRTKAGDNAGSVDGEYFRVGLQGKKYACHRVIYEMFNGPIPDGLLVDHKNRNAMDNSIANLRLVSFKANSQNRSLASTNKSGFTGVFRDTTVNKQKRSYTYWVAQWRDHDSRVCKKRFNVATYGEEEAFKLAYKCREKALSELNHNGESYTETHGKQQGEENGND